MGLGGGGSDDVRSVAAHDVASGNSGECKSDVIAASVAEVSSVWL